MSEAPAAGAAPQARIELGTAAITRERSTAVSRLALSAAGLSWLASSFIRAAWPAYKMSVEEPIPGMKWSVYNRIVTVQPNSLLLQALGFLTMGLFAVAVVAYFVTRRQRSYGAVRLDGDTMVLAHSDTPERRVAMADIVSVEEVGPGLVIELTNGTRFTLATQARSEISAAIARRRSSLDQLRVSRGLVERSLSDGLMQALPWAGWFALLGGWQTAGHALHSGNALGVVVLSMLTVAWAAFGAWHWSPARMTIGADGVRLSGRGRPRFVAFADVRAIETSRTLALRLRDGSAVVVGKNEPRLAGRLTAALASYREPGRESPTQHEHVLRRGERSKEAWRTELQKLAHKQDYRAELFDEEALASVVADPRVDAEQRVAAALALPKSDESRERIRIAAQSSADEHLARALEAAANDEVAEEELARAMRKRL